MNQPHAPEQHASCNLQESNGRRPHNIAAVAALYCAIGDYALFALSALMMYTLEQMPYHPANVLMLIASGLLFLAALPVAGFTVILAVLGLVQCNNVELQKIQPHLHATVEVWAWQLRRWL